LANLKNSQGIHIQYGSDVQR